MKQFFALFALLVGFVGVSVAEEVSPTIAMRVASEVLGGATRSGDVAIVWDSSAIGATRGGDDAPTFYVVAPELGSGFVIVAGDDVVTPILAYSTRYSAPSSEVLPPNFEGWLRYVDSAVRFAREHNVESDGLTVEKWNEEYKPVDALMLNTARWSQVPPYNNHCPMDGDARSLTGCTQTAMAIIMHHHRWPARAQGVTEPYTTMTQGIAVDARDINHAYEWNLMRETYVEGEYSDAEAEAVAVLMADIGHAFKADYAALATGAMPDMMALYKNFGYSPSAHVVLRQSHSDNYWHAMLRRELEAGRPLYYAGYTADWSGHAFVIDGVDENDYFHVNWGWGGPYDGFFLIDNLLLGEYHFDTEHWVVFGMHPMRDGEIDNWLYLTSSGLNIATKEFVENVPFDVKPISVGNYSQLDFRGEVRVGLCDKSGEFKASVTEAAGIELLPLFASSTDGMKGVIKDDIAVGDRLAVFYRSHDSDKWFRMKPYVESACAEVVVRYAPIGETTSMWYDKESGALVVKYDDDVKSALYLQGEYVDEGITISTGRMLIDTNQLQRGVTYTIYLERKDVESKSVELCLNNL